MFSVNNIIVKIKFTLINFWLIKKIKINKVKAKVRSCPIRTDDSTRLIDFIIDKTAIIIYPINNSNKGFLYVSWNETFLNNKGIDNRANTFVIISSRLWIDILSIT